MSSITPKRPSVGVGAGGQGKPCTHPATKSAPTRPAAIRAPPDAAPQSGCHHIPACVPASAVVTVSVHACLCLCLPLSLPVSFYLSESLQPLYPEAAASGL